MRICNCHSERSEGVIKNDIDLDEQIFLISNNFSNLLVRQRFKQLIPLMKTLKKTN